MSKPQEGSSVIKINVTLEYNKLIYSNNRSKAYELQKKNIFKELSYNDLGLIQLNDDHAFLNSILMQRDHS